MFAFSGRAVRCPIFTLQLFTFPLFLQPCICILLIITLFLWLWIVHETYCPIVVISSLFFSHKNNCCLLYSLMCLTREEDHSKKKKSMSYRCKSDKSDSFISEDWHQTNSYQLCVKFWRQRMKSCCYWITGNKLIWSVGNMLLAILSSFIYT